jgi:hypothetical protein
MKNYYWKIISLKEAKKLFKKKSKVYMIYEDESYCQIDCDRDFDDVVESSLECGIKVSI